MVWDEMKVLERTWSAVSTLFILSNHLFVAYSCRLYKKERKEKKKENNNN